MMSSEKTTQALDVDALTIIKYPDPRLRQSAAAVEHVDDYVRRLVGKMFELMFASRGVGLAANQVGVSMRIFVASPTFDDKDRRVYINPRIISADGWQEGEEGCLSFPGISVNIKRHQTATIEALDLDGRLFQETATDITARIFQHETDHLNGQLLIDRMGSVAKLAYRRTLKDLQEAFEQKV